MQQEESPTRGVGTAAARAGTDAAGDRGLQRAGDEVSAGQVDQRPVRSRQAQTTSADTGAEW